LVPNFGLPHRFGTHEDRDRGFSSEAAFIRYAVSQEVTFREEELVGAEERLAATIE
jgi:hypothetical protein